MQQLLVPAWRVGIGLLALVAPVPGLGLGMVAQGIVWSRLPSCHGDDREQTASTGRPSIIFALPGPARAVRPVRCGK